MITILHLSDLHRTSQPRMDNDELLSSISSDAKRWHEEGISAPDLIVVSGDVVQGSPIADKNSATALQAQYKEAENLLTHLCNEFVAADRLRVVIVPGNHDVHWRQAKEAMETLPECPSNIVNLAFSPTSDVRWSWGDKCAYKITDRAGYDARCQPFKDFVNSFYEELDTSPIVGPSDDLFFAEYSDLDLAVVGLPSWSGNDCFCPVGHIDSATMAECQKLIDSTAARIKVAVWHHSVVGSPTKMDYMDQRIVHKLIDYGIQIGFHGHQHLTGAVPFTLKLPNLTSMVVVSAGSLAVGDQELPMGEHRQFNIVEIDELAKSVRVNVREMSPSGVFSKSYRNDFGGATFLDLKLPTSTTEEKKIRPSKLDAVANDIIEAIGEKRYDDVLTLTSELGDAYPAFRRKAEIFALEALGQDEILTNILRPPKSPEEAIKLIVLLIKLRRWDDAEHELNLNREKIPRGILKDLRRRISVGKLLP